MPTGLLHELTPDTVGKVPARLAKYQHAAQIVNQLNLTVGSPLHRRIRTTTNPDGNISHTAMLNVVLGSTTDGVLYEHRNPADGTIDVDAAMQVLSRWWAAVAQVFPDAFDAEARPRDSRLLHGAGIRAVGTLMDTVVARTRQTDQATFIEALTAIAPRCAWLPGQTWTFPDGQTRRWNEIQNTGQDIAALSNLLRHWWLTHGQPTAA